MAKEQIKMIPVTRDTEEMFRWVGHSYDWKPDGNDNFKWIQNYTWSDTLTLVEMGRGQSAAFFVLKSEISGKTYYMFMKDLLDMILSRTIEKGKISGNFTYVKRGNNYGVKVC